METMSILGTDEFATPENKVERVLGTPSTVTTSSLGSQLPCGLASSAGTLVCTPVLVQKFGTDTAHFIQLYRNSSA